MSSPDPLNDSIPSSLARPVTRSQRSKNFITIGGTSVSPRRQTFSLEVGDNRSPQRLFVTVESEQRQKEQAGAVRRRLFPSSSPSKRSPSKTPRARTTTTTVPLRDDDDDDEDDLTGMTATTPRKRGRPRKYAPTPKPGAKKRAGTPARKGTPGRPRKNPVAEDEPASEARTQPTPRASAKKRASATAGQEPASDATQATPASSQGKRGAKRKAVDEEPSSAPATSAKKRGRPRKKPLVEEVPEVPEEKDAIEPPAVAEAENPPAPEPVGPADNDMPASDGDLWMDTLSNEATPRPSFRSRSLNRSTVTAEPPNQSPEPPNATEADDYAPLVDARDDTPEQAEQADSDLDEVLLVPRPTDTMSDAMSEASRPGFGRRPREDTIVQSEEFSMIFTESMRSLRASARGAPVTNASDEIGDDTNLFINKTLESIRNGMQSDAGSSEHGRDNGSTGREGEQDREVEELPQEQPPQEQESFSLSLFARSQFDADPEFQHNEEYEERHEEQEEQQHAPLDASFEHVVEPEPHHVEEHQRDDQASSHFGRSVRDSEHAVPHTEEQQEEHLGEYQEEHQSEQQRVRHTSPLIALSEDDVEPGDRYAQEQEDRGHTSPLYRHSMRAMESQLLHTDEQQQEEQRSSPHERSMRNMESEFQHDEPEHEEDNEDLAQEYHTQEPEWEDNQPENSTSQSRQAPAEPQPESSPAVASPTPWWSESPRRNKTPSLGRQLLTFKAMQSQQSLAGESPSQPPFARSRDSSRHSSANPGEDSNLYEDSFSEIPDAVLEAATPRRTERTGAPAPDPSPLQQPDAQGKDVVSGVSVATDTIRSDASRMLTPDETPSPQRHDSAPEPKPVEAAPVDTKRAPEPAREPSKSASPAPAEQPNLLALRRSSQDKVTPAAIESSPQLPGLPDANAHRVSPEQERRPTLSPIMRAGLALQSVTSDHSSPLGKTLGSPFKASSNATPRRNSLQGRDSEQPAARSASHQPEVPSSDDPFGPSRVHNGQDSFMRALDESARHLPSQRSSAPPSAFNSTRATRATLEELEEMSWVAEDPTPVPIAYETVESRSSSMSGNFGSIMERQNAGNAEAGEVSNAREAEDEGNDEDDEDIWVTEAQRSSPKQPQRRAFGAGATQRGARRNLIPDTWRRNARTTPSAETVEDRLNESQLEEYSLLSQKKNTSMRLPSSAAKPGLDLSKFFSSPTVLPNMPSGNLTRRNAPPRAAPTPAQTLPSNSMFPAVPQKAFQPSPVRRNLFSSAASASVATSAAPQTSPTKSTGTSVAERQQAAPSTPERTSEHPVVEQKQNFTPRRGQSASLFVPSSARATVPTPPQMQLSRNDIERWQEETSRVLGESPESPEVQREQLPHRTMSPTKSCLRSPLKARTPGRVVEFAGEVTSPLQARGGANARRLVGVQLQPKEDVAEVQERPREVSVASPVKGRQDVPAAQPKPRMSVPELQPRPREAAPTSPLKARDTVLAAQLKPKVPAPAVQFKPGVSAVQEEDKENSPSDTSATEAPPQKPHRFPRLSRSIWSKNHWLLLDTLLQLRRKGPYPFDIQASGYVRRSAGLLGRVASGEGKTMEIEAWHLDIVDAFRAEVGGWDEGVLAKRLFALVAGEGGRVRA